MVFSEKQIESYNGMAQSVERWTAGTVGTVGYRYIPGCCQEFFSLCTGTKQVFGIEI